MGDKSTSCCWFPMRLPKAHPCLIGTAWLQETGVNISGVPELKLGTPALQSVWKGSGTSPCSPHRYNVGQRAVGCQQHPQGHHDMHRALAGTLPPLAHREIPTMGTSLQPFHMGPSKAQQGWGWEPLYSTLYSLLYTRQILILILKILM